MTDAPASTVSGRSSAGTFAPGNPGKPRGARHRATRAVEEMLDGDRERLTRKVIELALAGDPTALRTVFERLCSPRRDRPIEFALPPISSASDHPPALAALPRPLPMAS